MYLLVPLGNITTNNTTITDKLLYILDCLFCRRTITSSQHLSPPPPPPRPFPPLLSYPDYTSSSSLLYFLSLFVSDVMIINTVILSSSPRPSSSSSVQRDPTPPFFATRSFFPFCQVPPPLFRSLSFVVRMTPSLSSHLRLPIMSKLRFFSELIIIFNLRAAIFCLPGLFLFLMLIFYAFLTLSDLDFGIWGHSMFRFMSSDLSQRFFLFPASSLISVSVHLLYCTTFVHRHSFFFLLLFFPLFF